MVGFVGVCAADGRVKLGAMVATDSLFPIDISHNIVPHSLLAMQL